VSLLDGDTSNLAVDIVLVFLTLALVVKKRRIRLRSLHEVTHGIVCVASECVLYSISYSSVSMMMPRAFALWFLQGCMRVA